MPKLTVTNNLPSMLTLGDPGTLTLIVPPKSSKTVAVSAAHLEFLNESLTKLTALKWLSYTVDAPSTVEAPPAAVIVPPAPVVAPPVVTPVPVPEPVAAPEPIVPPEPVVPPAESEPVTEGEAVKEDAPVTVKTPFSKNRSR
jgi:hypothetical protein